jgi:single-strand DNA-binding protein
MASSVNKVFLLGNLTRDPELRYTPNGSAVTDLGIAVNRSYTTKDGERREEVTFVDVTVWNRTAENCCQYLKKGRPVHIEGFLKLDTWDDKTTGEKRSKLKVEADNVQFLGSPRDEPGGGSARDDEGPAPATRRPNAPPANGAGAPRKDHNAGPSSPARRPAPEPEADDDIPF